MLVEILSKRGAKKHTNPNPLRVEGFLPSLRNLPNPNPLICGGVRLWEGSKCHKGSRIG